MVVRKVPPLEGMKSAEAGDVIALWCGTKRITAIEPYTGPHDFVFAIAAYEPGPTRGISLCRGDYFDVLVT